MKTFKGLVSTIAIVIGFTFMLSGATDFHLGIGVILVSMGLLNL